MSKVLVTGIAGFIGSSLARVLLAQGAQVRGLDNLTTGAIQNIEEILPRIDFRHADILDPHAISSACEGVDFVFHEAAIPSVPVSIQNPIGTNRTNLEGTLCVLEASRRAGVRRLLYAASSAVYGDSAHLPKAESMLPDPISPYAVQKAAGEYYLRSYSRIYGLETVSLRYFNVFGPRQDPSSPYSGVLAKFITQMLANEEPTIFGDGQASRDFTFIDNVVQANIKVCQAPAKQVVGRVFNVATGRGVTLNDAYNEIGRILGYSGSVRYAAERAGDIRHSVADISAARTAFGYEVTTQFEAGLERTIAWYRECTATVLSMMVFAQ
jgi:UDP-glucose 4-epimerase